MFADGALSGLSSTGTCAASDKAVSTAGEPHGGVIEEQSLSTVEGLHLVPCYMHFSGTARVSDNFKPKRLVESSNEYEVLLHGRHLLGREILLSESADGIRITGYAAVTGDTAASLDELRNDFVGNASLGNCEMVCDNNEQRRCKTPTIQTRGNFTKFV